MSDKTEKIAQFVSITGASEERASFFLDSAAWQIDVAMTNFYENEGEGGGVDDPVVTVSPNQETAASDSPPTPNTIQARSKPKRKPANAKFATLNTLSSSDDEEEEGQAFYAGGSEHSGQQVLGPSKRKDIVADMFRSVTEHGVEVVESRPSTSNPRAFKGTGYKLGETGADSVSVPGVTDPTTPSEVTLKLWKTGFSVNDEEIRPYADPDNREFLESIRKGQIPQELRSQGNEVHLVMEDHRMETFKTPGRKQKAFSGTGYTLGNPAPPVVGACREEDKPVNEEVARENINIDSSQPVTSVQIRLADGSRLVAQFNHGHTIGEIRSYILTARPQYATQTFNLLSSYPSKILEDSQTIEQAGLLNSAIMQKML